jgi:hypothetical protein
MATAQNGNQLFDDSFLHKIEFHKVDVSKIKDPLQKLIYQSVEIKIDGNLLENVGLATKGEKSYVAAPNDKKPFKVKTDKFVSGQKYDGVKRFNLNNNLYDKSIMREKFTFEASRAMGIPSPRCAFAEVYINGEYWGIYTLVEAQDEIYKRTFGNNNGVTIESFGSSANLSNLAFYGDKPEDYKGQYIVDHGDEEVAWKLWIRLLEKIQNLPARYGYVDSISNYIDYHSYFKFNAVLDYNLNAEPKNKNGIYYFDVTAKKWFTICWDQNVSFPEFADADQLNFPITQMTAFLDKVFTYKEFTDAYCHALCQLSGTIFTEDEVSKRIAAYRKLIDKAVENDGRKGFTYKEYELSLVALREFTATRNTAATDFLLKKGYTCTSTSTQPELEIADIRVFPNPADNFLNVSTSESSGSEYTIRNLQGIVLQKGAVWNSTINISSLPKGIFIIELHQSGNRVAVRKFSKV